MTQPSDIDDLLHWAGSYYPSRAIRPPNIAALRLTAEEVIDLFGRLPSGVAHLALVDQPAIRGYFTEPAVVAAANDTWKRNVDHTL